MFLALLLIAVVVATGYLLVKKARATGTSAVQIVEEDLSKEAATLADAGQAAVKSKETKPWFPQSEGTKVVNAVESAANTVVQKI